jgi:hypothetical protein
VFPSVYVDVITPLPSPVPQSKALYDFKMNSEEEEGCLAFKKVFDFFNVTIFTYLFMKLGRSDHSDKKGG